VQELLRKVLPETRVRKNGTKGVVMNISNLARRLEDFAALEDEARSAARRLARMKVVVARNVLLCRPPAFAARRIEIRDSGLRPFRVL
jgi:hypothetical protein